MNIISHIILIFSFCVVQDHGAVNLRKEARNHKAISLSEEQVVKLALRSNISHFQTLLAPILVPRVVGTPSHEKVKEYLISTMLGVGWTVETDPFEDVTPGFGKLKFENVIAKLNPNAQRYLVIACHYDSKYFREDTFIGATDSAVPCAMMIDLAFTMKEELAAIQSRNDVSLKFVFFDGEEAFRTWGPRDSIYGARHLASQWQNTALEDGQNYLSRLDMMVLLDLLGAPNPNFFSYFANTEQWYRLMMHAEGKLISLKESTKYSVKNPRRRYFQEKSTNGGIEDDHIPFLKRDVPILHVIPVPFPAVWHTFDDNLRAVDFPTVDNLNKILRVFVAEYLHIPV